VQAAAQRPRLSFCLSFCQGDLFGAAVGAMAPFAVDQVMQIAAVLADHSQDEVVDGFHAAVRQPGFGYQPVAERPYDQDDQVPFGIFVVRADVGFAPR
jgi:hypothetical protein